MTMIFIISPNELDRWTVTGNESVRTGKREFVSLHEAHHALEDQLKSRGLVVGNPVPSGEGYIVEVTPGPLLYSGAASRLIEDLKGRFGRKLRQVAVELAERQGRYLITDDDVWAALETLVGSKLDEDPEDG